MDKRSRSENWDMEEKELLLTLIREEIDILNAKGNNTKMNKAKAETWKRITEKFNSLISRKRDLVQIKIQWKGMKVKSKKEVSNYKSDLKKTGGGPMPTLPSQESVEILEMIPLEFQGGTNDFDCDADSDHNEVIQEVDVVHNQNLNSECPRIGDTDSTTEAESPRSGKTATKNLNSEGQLKIGAPALSRHAVTPRSGKTATKGRKSGQRSTTDDDLEKHSRSTTKEFEF